MKKILLLTDFSEASRHALQFTRSFFSDTVADIHLLCAYPVEKDDFYSPGHIAQTAHTAFADQLLALVAELGRESATTWHSFRSTARPGNLLDVVQEELAGQRYDYVVVGAKKDGTNELFGNSATSLIRQLHANILVVPVDASPVPVRHLVLAIDFASLKNCKLLSPVKELVTLKGATLTLLSIDLPDKVVVTAEQETYIRTFLAPVEPRVAHVKAASVSEGIDMYLATHAIDCLVTIPRHKTWTDVVAGTSVSRSLAYIPPVPLLTLYDDGSTDRPRLLQNLSNLDYAL